MFVRAVKLILCGIKDRRPLMWDADINASAIDMVVHKMEGTQQAT